MKNIVSFITEKLKIGKTIKINPMDINSDFHKYKISEVKKLLSTYDSYAVDLIAYDKDFNAYDLNFDIMTKDGSSDKEYKNIYHILSENHKTNINFIINKKNNYSVKAEQILDAIIENSNRDKQIAVGLYDEYRSYEHLFDYYLWRTSAPYGRSVLGNVFVIYNIQIEDSSKTIKLYLCIEKFLNAIISKSKSAEYNTNSQPNLHFYDKSNEDKLTREILAVNPKSDIQDIPDSEKYRGKYDESKLFWKVYATLLLYGEMRKTDVLQTINDNTGLSLELTSYTTSFSDWSKRNMIVSNKGKLSPVPYENWIKKK